MTRHPTWHTAGTYSEVCNCEAICPCRQVDGHPGGRSTFADCRFALSWFAKTGQYERVNLHGGSVVMAGWYDDDELHSLSGREQPLGPYIDAVSKGAGGSWGCGRDRSRNLDSGGVSDFSDNSPTSIFSARCQQSCLLRG